jgi:hypothetical protein
MAIALLVAFSACGARTGLGVLEGDIDARDAAEDEAQLGDGPTADGGGGWCSLYEGPIASCDASPAAGPIQRCVEMGPYATTCLNYGGAQWGCCIVNPPNGLESCYYPAGAPPEDRCGDY